MIFSEAMTHVLCGGGSGWLVLVVVGGCVVIVGGCVVGGCVVVWWPTFPRVETVVSLVFMYTLVFCTPN